MFLANARQQFTHCGFTKQKFGDANGRRNEKEVLITGPFPSLPNPLSLFASFPFPFRLLPGKANQSEAARVHGSDCAGLRRA